MGPIDPPTASNVNMKLQLKQNIYHRFIYTLRKMFFFINKTYTKMYSDYIKQNFRLEVRYYIAKIFD